SGEQALRQKRAELASVEARQRLALREARGNAAREGERALALAEEARDLDGLIARLGENAERRVTLAALPGPVLRPDNPGDTLGPAPQPQRGVPSSAAQAAAAATGAPARFQLPVQGRTITGFGERRESGLRSKGLTLSPAPGAQIVAPAEGRIVFSGPYEGFGRIVIIEHPGGLTSLVTGLARVDVEVGDTVIGGAPLGVADGEGGAIGVELRDQGGPVNPLDYLV
ncbi:MAG: peptidoglycan DD-metalloendopeptidase family protein, partial [Pseudomonadota bacterium]